jgi:hypothetical protein
VVAAILSCCGGAALPAAAAAQAAPQPIAPYDGSNPFNCELQDVGTGTAFPDPGADPFCVKFNKTNQNLTDFGLVDFLLQEPARLAAAAPKCFYYQQDEWTGSIVQGEQPELWHWVGGYWFDRARGLGGVSAREFRVGGVPFSAAPFAPAAYRPYFDEAGGGGVQLQLATNPGLGCAEMVDTPEERAAVFKDEAVISDCIEPGGPVRGRRIGAVKLGSTRDEVRGALGDPLAAKGRAETWCVIGGEYLQVVFRGTQNAAVVIRTTAAGHTIDGIGAGSGLERASRRLGLNRLFRIGRTRVFATDSRPHALLGARGDRVEWLAIADPGTLRGAVLRRTLKRSL